MTLLTCNLIPRYAHSNANTNSLNQSEGLGTDYCSSWAHELPEVWFRSMDCWRRRHTLICICFLHVFFETDPKQNLFVHRDLHVFCKWPQQKTHFYVVFYTDLKVFPKTSKKKTPAAAKEVLTKREFLEMFKDCCFFFWILFDNGSNKNTCLHCFLYRC